MTTTRFTYKQLIELVEGDHELITRLVEEGEIEQLRHASSGVVATVPGGGYRFLAAVEKDQTSA